MSARIWTRSGDPVGGGEHASDDGREAMTG